MNYLNLSAYGSLALQFITGLIETESFPKAFRIVLEYITDLVSNFILRKEVWTKLLSETH